MVSETHRRKAKKNLKNLLASGYEEDVKRFLDAYGDIVLGDGQDPEAYQKFSQLDLEDKWNYIKEHEGESEEELVKDFWKWNYDEDFEWDEDNMSDDYYNLMELEDDNSSAENPVTKVTEVDKDDDGDKDVTVIEQNDGNDSAHLPKKSAMLIGDLTPEEIEMIQFARKQKKSKGLTGEQTPEEIEMLQFAREQMKSKGLTGEQTPEEKNMINSFAKLLKNYKY
jgi:hypothetical protein